MCLAGGRVGPWPQHCVPRHSKHKSCANDVLLLGQHRRCWPNIKPTLAQRLVFGGESVSEYCFTSLSAQSWQYRDKRKPVPGIMPYSYRMTSRVLYSAQHHRQHCTLHAFEQLGALYMHSPDDKHPTRPGFENNTSEFRGTTGQNETAGSASCLWTWQPHVSEHGTRNQCWFKVRPA